MFFRLATDCMTSLCDPRLMTVRVSTASMRWSSTEPLPLCEAPPAASTTNASGAHSYSSRSLDFADSEAGLQKTPPPAVRMWCTSGTCSTEWAKGRTPQDFDLHCIRLQCLHVHSHDSAVHMRTMPPLYLSVCRASIHPWTSCL
jgi:hypothetical protein